jgi:hypothetical protein
MRSNSCDLVMNVSSNVSCWNPKTLNILYNFTKCLFSCTDKCDLLHLSVFLYVSISRCFVNDMFIAFSSSYFYFQDLLSVYLCVLHYHVFLFTTDNKVLLLLHCVVFLGFLVFLYVYTFCFLTSFCAVPLVYKTIIVN